MKERVTASFALLISFCRSFESMLIFVISFCNKTALGSGHDPHHYTGTTSTTSAQARSITMALQPSTNSLQRHRNGDTTELYMNTATHTQSQGKCAATAVQR